MGGQSMFAFEATFAWTLAGCSCTILFEAITSVYTNTHHYARGRLMLFDKAIGSIPTHDDDRHDTPYFDEPGFISKDGSDRFTSLDHTLSFNVVHFEISRSRPHFDTQGRLLSCAWRLYTLMTTMFAQSHWIDLLQYTLTAVMFFCFTCL